MKDLWLLLALITVVCCVSEPTAKITFSFSTERAQACLNATKVGTATSKAKMLCEHLEDGGNNVLWESSDFTNPDALSPDAVGHAVNDLGVEARGLDAEMFETPVCSGGMTGNFNDWSHFELDASEDGMVWSKTVEDSDFVAGYEVAWMFMLCAGESDSVARLQEHFSLLPTKTFDKLSSCTKWSSDLDTFRNLHWQNRHFVIPDNVKDGETIELDTYYFNECESLDVEIIAVDGGRREMPPYLLPAIAVVFVFLMLLFFYKTRDDQALIERVKSESAQQKESLLEMETKLQTEKRGNEMNRMSKNEVCLVTDNLKRIKENAEEARLFEGMKIHRKDLTIDHVVASGSFGKVSMGYYEENSVAVKQLLKLTQDDIDRFKFECFLSKELRHPHIVRTVGVVWEKDCMALVSEFVANGSLGSWLNKDYERRVSGDPDVWTWKREMLKMACDIADGVMYLHNAHYYDVRSKAWQECIIHRDLKPDNFLVTDSMHVKITDFGEARALDIKGEMTVVGTPLYIAPEVMRNERYGKRVDSYSFGVVLFACLRLRPTAFEAFASSLKEDMNKSSNRGIGAAILAHRIDVGWRPRIP
ncbi:hypothetical protein TrRE_jg49, partial [Triparma retinervis]